MLLYLDSDGHGDCSTVTKALTMVSERWWVVILSAANICSKSTKDILEQNVNKENRKIPLASFGCLYYWLWTHFALALVFLLLTLTSVEQQYQTRKKNCSCFIFSLKNVNSFCQFSATFGMKGFLFKVACRVKANMTWTTKNTNSFHYFSQKFKTSTFQELEK